MIYHSQMLTKLYTSIVALSILACSNQTYVNHTVTNPGVTSGSVVSVMEPYVAVDDDYDSGISMAIKLRESCSAFAVSDVDTTYLVTAAHCLSNPVPGAKFRYEYYEGIGTEVATVDVIRGDVAVATVNDSKLVPLRVNGSYHPTGLDLAVAVSVTYSDVSYGRVIGELTHGYFDTDQTIRRGWSGSPVLNEKGNVWGLLSMCKVTNGESDCDPDYAIVASIY
jgi:trypsin-like peptidase